MKAVVSKIIEWRENPIQFVRDNFQVEPDNWQREVLLAFASTDKDKQRIAMKACSGPGKSAVLAWVGWNFLCCYGETGEHPKGAAVSVTESNLRDNLWTEFSKWQQKSPFLQALFTWTKTRIFSKHHPDTWFISARSFPKSADVDTLGKTLSGIHSKYVLFLIDESGDIPPQVGKVAEQALTDTEGLKKIIQAGNPISKSGLLYSSVSNDHWYVVSITSDPDDVNRTPRVDAQWAREQIDKYGKDDPWIKSYILGQFPDSAINTLLSIEEIEESMCRVPNKTNVEMFQKKLGVDVARFGLDSTIIFPRQGRAAFKYAVMRNARSDEIAARIMKAKGDWGSDLEFIDGTGGYGSGVVDSLRLAGQSPFEINFSSKAISEKYFNKRSEMWFLMADWVKSGGCLYKDNTLKKELAAPTYTFHNGKFLLEPKEQIKKRLGFSPDIADALALTFALPDLKKEVLIGTNKSKLKSSYDPLERF